jgi:hypothetical protein
MSSSGPASVPDSVRRGRARTLQLALAFVWLLDAILQFQAFMFGRGFADMLRQTATGNPAIIAGPISWSARLIAQHDVAANAAFAAIQLAVGLGIAWRPTLRFALGLSIVWSVAVWWLGEGLGGLLTGTASPLNGAPGAVLLYALLAVLLWPRRRDQGGTFVPAGAVGPLVARLMWLVIWGGLAWLAILPATAAPRALAGMVTEVSAGQPGWLAEIDGRLAGFLGHHGPGAAILLAVVLAVVAAGIYLPPPAVRAVVGLAVVTAAALWLAQGLGGMLTGSATDPQSAPLLALLAVAYWPRPTHKPELQLQLQLQPQPEAQPQRSEPQRSEPQPAERQSQPCEPLAREPQLTETSA